MGQVFASYFSSDRHIMPDFNNPPTFDPLYGFPDRKERRMIATEEEMVSAKIPLEHRDYCAHKYLKFQSCKADNYPWVYKCHHEKHEYFHCEYEDYVLRMKEYERERRLLKRKQLKERQNSQEELSD